MCDKNDMYPQVSIGMTSFGHNIRFSDRPIMSNCRLDELFTSSALEEPATGQCLRANKHVYSIQASISLALKN